MAQINGDIQDIFRGAEKIEIFGKLPGYLWSYIDTAHALIRDLRGNSGIIPEPTFSNLEKLTQILYSAAEHLNNEDLKAELNRHSDILDRLKTGEAPLEETLNSFSAVVDSLQNMAGRRHEAADSILDTATLDKEILRAEKIKGGRSADVFISAELIKDIRDYLTREFLSEGISTVLVIDSAGTLIVNIGDKLELDVVGLAAVAAANFAATEQIARLIGEEDFVLLFYKGHLESFHFCRVGTEYIIVTIFDNALSLGLLRLKINEVAQVLETKLPHREA